MSKVKVYSRFEQPLEFRFVDYTKAEGGKEVAPCEDADRIVLNGVNEVVNHTRIAVPYATTVFSDKNGHDVKGRTYTLADLERLKKHPTFKKLLANGDVSIDTTDDISRDFTGVGKLSDAELAERSKSQSEENRVTIVK